MRERIEGKQFDEERSLYNLTGADVYNCVFAGPADGESVLKEARDVALRGCNFSLRYPLWHVRGFSMDGCSMDEKTRAAIWYSFDGVIKHTRMDGIKALRECENIRIEDSTAHSPGFGWRTRGLEIKRSEMESEYFLFECRNVTIDELKMK